MCIKKGKKLFFCFRAGICTGFLPSGIVKNRCCVFRNEQEKRVNNFVGRCCFTRKKTYICLYIIMIP